MNTQHMHFMATITKRLADTFNELNEMCQSQLNYMENNKEQNQEQLINNLKDQQILIQDITKNDQMIKQKNNHIQKNNRSKSQQKYKKDKKTTIIKKKKKIMSHKPKAPASSFLLYFKDQHRRIAEKYPNNTAVMLTKIAANCWNQLNQEDKQEYIDKCNVERKKYEKQIQIYRRQYPEQIAASKARNKERKLKLAVYQNKTEMPYENHQEQERSRQNIKYEHQIIKNNNQIIQDNSQEKIKIEQQYQDEPQKQIIEMEKAIPSNQQQSEIQRRIQKHQSAEIDSLGLDL